MRRKKNVGSTPRLFSHKESMGQPGELGEDVYPGPFTPRDEANAIVAYAFRNGPIEDLHAGKYSELLADPNFSRITDDEMKTIMVAACRKVEELLLLKECDPDEYDRRLRDYSYRYCQRW